MWHGTVLEQNKAASWRAILRRPKRAAPDKQTTGKSYILDFGSCLYSRVLRRKSGLWPEA
jgi:hypothetical protein